MSANQLVVPVEFLTRINHGERTLKRALLIHEQKSESLITPLSSFLFNMEDADLQILPTGLHAFAKESPAASEFFIIHRGKDSPSKKREHVEWLRDKLISPENEWERSLQRAVTVESEPCSMWFVLDRKIAIAVGRGVANWLTTALSADTLAHKLARHEIDRILEWRMVEAMPFGQAAPMFGGRLFPKSSNYIQHQVLRVSVDSYTTDLKSRKGKFGGQPAIGVDAIFLRPVTR